MSEIPMDWYGMENKDRLQGHSIILVLHSIPWTWGTHKRQIKEEWSQFAVDDADTPTFIPLYGSKHWIP